MDWLVIGLGASVLIFSFVMLAAEVTEGDTQAFDVRILRALRNAADPSTPIGPPWLQNAMLDLTALGGTTLLALAVLSVAGFLLLQARWRLALVIATTSITGELLNIALKHVFNRPRPDVMFHLREVSTASFPSGHAMESAIVYLTLGAMLMRVAERRATKLYCLGVAMLLTALAGISRVYLGVHYPTDVVGGWIVGFVWASLCWEGAQYFEVHPPAETE